MESKRNTKPGDKRAAWARRNGRGPGDNLRAWLELMGIKASLYIREGKEGDDNADSKESGAEVSVYLIHKNSRIRLPLSSMNMHELNATKEFFDAAFASARPTVELRDRLAQEAFEDGDDTFYRLYRDVPKLFVREGPQFTDGEKLLRGHDWVPAVDSYEADPRSIAGIAGSSVPKRDARDRSAEDDTSKVDLDASVRKVDGQ